MAFEIIEKLLAGKILYALIAGRKFESMGQCTCKQFYIDPAQAEDPVGTVIDCPCLVYLFDRIKIDLYFGFIYPLHGQAFDLVFIFVTPGISLLELLGSEQFIMYLMKGAAFIPFINEHLRGNRMRRRMEEVSQRMCIGVLTYIPGSFSIRCGHVRHQVLYQGQAIRRIFVLMGYRSALNTMSKKIGLNFLR